MSHWQFGPESTLTPDSMATFCFLFFFCSPFLFIFKSVSLLYQESVTERQHCGVLKEKGTLFSWAIKSGFFGEVAFGVDSEDMEDYRAQARMRVC